MDARITIVRLCDLPQGRPARILKIGPAPAPIGARPTPGANRSPDGMDLERRLLEMGFEEGKRVEVLHVGPIGRDPLAVRIEGMTVGIRRREAAAVVVEPIDP